jgi:hypothetical protein
LKNKDGGVKNTAAERQSPSYAKVSLISPNPDGEMDNPGYRLE